MDRRYFIGACAVAVAGGAGVWLTQSPSVPNDLLVGAANAQEAGDVDTSGIVEMVMGDENAPVTLVEYASFTCPHCANFHGDQLKKLKSDYVDTGKVRVIYRDVYFDRFGLWAAMVARCDPDRFFGIADMLYAQQKDWIGDGSPAVIGDNLRKIGRVAGLDEEKLDACLGDGDAAKALVAWFQENATVDDISSTPTLIIDGEKHNNMSYSELREILDAKLGS